MERKNKKSKSVGNGEGSLYFSEKLNCYVFQYYYDGKRKTLKQKKGEQAKEFKNRVVALKVEIGNGTYIEKSKDTFLSICEKHIKQKYDDGLVSDRTYYRDNDTLTLIKKCCSNFVDKPIQKITIEDIQTAKKNMRDYSNSTIDKMWILINKCFKIALSRRLIPYNIMLDESLSKPISKKEDKKIEALTVEEENRLIEVFNNQEKDHKYRDIILLQLYTGMRIGEVLALSKDCIDLEDNTLTVYRTLTRDDKGNVVMGKHTKTFVRTVGIDKGKRTFPMTQQVRDLINKILTSKNKNIYNLLFWDYQNCTFISYNELNAYLRRINEKYHICSTSLHTHRLRHTFVTRCIEKGISLSVIQEIVGHVQSSSITLDTYTSISNNFIEQELKKLI